MNLKHTQTLLEQLERGAFLTVQSGDALNTMTVGWGSIGVFWSKPVLIVPVRYSRHTYDLLMQTETFTVSVPTDSSMKEALAVAGSQSGRDLDKFEALGLTAVPGKTVPTPIVGECGLHYECRVLHHQTLEPHLLDPKIRSRFYPDHNYHVLFFGEILAEYTR